MIETIISEAEQKMEASSEALRRDLASIRTGRASPAIIENVKVEYGGGIMPLKHIAGISASGASLLIVQPWDPASVHSIEKAILKANLGMNPSVDGNIIRLKIPPLTEERRKEFIKMVKKRTEDGRIGLRNIRRDALEELKKLEKDKEISQDDHKRAADGVQALTDSFTSVLEKTGQDKETELMEV